MRNKIFIAALIGICTLMHGCRDAEEKKAMEPEAVAEAFCRAVAAGDFETASSLCSAADMAVYLDRQKEGWDEAREKEDSSALLIASDMLSDIGITIDEVIKEDNRRHVFCSIGFEGNKKEKVMILQKEEGEWKVMPIADRT